MPKKAILIHGRQGLGDTWVTNSDETAKFLESRFWDARAVGPAPTDLYKGPHARPPRSRPCLADLQFHIDCALLSAHSGHGTEKRVSAGDRGLRSVFLEEMAPECHYFFFFSCLVMAHGKDPHHEPWLATSGDPNVFLRWKHGLSRSLRMLGGGAGIVIVDGNSGKNAFQPVVDLHQPVSNSYVLAVSRPLRIGSCLTLGDERPEATPLCTDREFIDQKNPFRNGNFAYLQYPVWRSADRARAYWGAYVEKSTPREDGRDEESSPPEIFEASPPTVLKLEKVISGDSGLDKVRHLVQSLEDSEFADHGLVVEWFFSEEIGMVNVWLRLEDPSAEFLERRAEWLRFAAAGADLLGSGLMHLADPPENFKCGTPGREAVQMWIDGVDLREPTARASGFVKDETGRLHPRLLYTDGPRQVLIPLLSPECSWSLRVAPQDAAIREGDGERNLVRALEADITVGGFHIAASHDEGALISPAEAARRAKELFDARNSTDASRYALDLETARCGYKLVPASGGPLFMLFYQFQLHSIEERLAGRLVEVPAFDSDLLTGLFPED